jgi:hypothetical protein
MSLAGGDGSSGQYLRYIYELLTVGKLDNWHLHPVRKAENTPSQAVH